MLHFFLIFGFGTFHSVLGQWHMIPDSILPRRKVEGVLVPAGTVQPSPMREKAIAKPVLPPHLQYAMNSQKPDGEAVRPKIYTSDEYKLYQTLVKLNNYSKMVRPVTNPFNPIDVYVGMCVMMIEDLIEREQTMIMSACVKMLWTDEYLQWSPTEYGNISWIALSSHSIWLPDIAIVNSPEPQSLTRKLTNIGVSYRGEVGFFPSGRLQTRCNLIITYFPFDWQNCEVRFESWIYPTKYMTINLYPGEEAIDVKEYYDNFQWSLKSYRVEIASVNYDNKNFSSLTIVFRLRRKPAFYFMYFIFPQLLLAALQTLSHTLPVEHPGRMAMLTALFIGTSVTHAGIATHIPKSSDTMSLLQIYMTVMSVNLVIALLITFVMLYTVLRYPNREPSFTAMMAAFFSIVWPQQEKGKEIFIYGINPNFENPTKITNQINNDVRKQTLAQLNSGKSNHVLMTLANDLGQKSTNKDYDDLSDDMSGKSLGDAPAADTGVKCSCGRSDGIHFATCESDIIWQPNPDSHCFKKSLKDCKHFGGLSPFSPLFDCEYFHSHNNGNVLPCLPSNQKGFQNKLILGDSSKPACKSCFIDENPYVNISRKRQSKSFGKHHGRTKTTIKQDENDDEESSTGYSSTVGLLRNGSYCNPYSSIPPGKKKKKKSTIGISATAASISNENFDVSGGNDQSELKKRWLMYCVALDKCIMYGNGVWNIIIPVFLFVVLPLAHDASHGSNFDEI